MKRIGIILISLFLILSKAYAGAAGFTIHSRANCFGFNESISWDATAYWRLITQSDHYYEGKRQHLIKTHDQTTKRSAACHPTESYDMITNPWVVWGIHWRFYYKDMGFHFEGGENVNNCSLYDGWWDDELLPAICDNDG